MRNLICFIILSSLVEVTGESQQKGNYVLLGQIYGTAQFGFPEKINGKVKEFRQLNFLPAVENGKIIKVRPLSTADRVTTPSGRDYFEEYDTSGVVIKSGTMHENGGILEYWDVDTDSGRIKKAFHYSNDKLISEINVRYTGNNISKFDYLIPGRTTVIRGVSIEYDQDGKRTKYKYYGASGLITSTTVLSYNLKNQLDSIRSYFSITTRSTMYFKYGYNDIGEKISQHQENYTDGDVRDYTFEYEYDKMGNYIKVIYLRDNKPFIYRERHIRYY